MAYILMIHHDKDSECLAIWSSLLEAEITYIRKTNPNICIQSYKVIDDDPTEEDCLILPKEINKQLKTGSHIKYLLPRQYSANYQWGDLKY